MEEMLNDLWDSLTEEQKAKARECKTVEELIRLAGEEGIELPDELLDAAAGGRIVMEIADGRAGTVRYQVFDKDLSRGYFKTEAEAVAHAKKYGYSTDMTVVHTNGKIFGSGC